MWWWHNCCVVFYLIKRKMKWTTENKNWEKITLQVMENTKLSHDEQIMLHKRLINYSLYWVILWMTQEVQQNTEWLYRDTYARLTLAITNLNNFVCYIKTYWVSQKSLDRGSFFNFGQATFGIPSISSCV